MPQGREDGATSFAVIRPGCESNYRTPAHLRILFIFLPAARLRRLLQTMEGQDLEVVLLTSRLISLPEPGHRSSTTSTPNNSATASHPRAHQPPFPRPPGRPNGCFRSLPPKANSKQYEVATGTLSRYRKGYNDERRTHERHSNLRGRWPNLGQRLEKRAAFPSTVRAYRTRSRRMVRI